MKSSKAVLMASVLALATSLPALAQQFPSKPVRLITPFGAGAGPEIVARLVGEDLAEADGDPRPRTEIIEEDLYRHRKSLFGRLSVAFFDNTSLYFEGQSGETLGQRGHSKDYRPQLNQVVLGIVLDERDRPIASFLWPGNTADVTTLAPVVERLRTRFGVERACVVADRGMISAATIADLEKRGIDYILGARERSSTEIRDVVLEDDGVTVPLTIPRQRGETDLAIKEVKVDGRRYIF